MNTELLSELQTLRAMPIQDVRAAWRQRFKTAPPAHRSKDLLIRAYAYQLQVLACGGLKRETRRKLDDLATRFADRAYTPAATNAPKPGSVYVRDWNGRRYAVTATEDGFLLDGERHTSLSAVAFAITGAKWSGPRFFRETRSEEAKAQ
jgi:hypothetical protein